MTTFVQLSARLKNFFRGWLLVLSPNEGLVECATVCVKSEVILVFSYAGKWKDERQNKYLLKKFGLISSASKFTLGILRVCKNSKSYSNTKFWPHSTKTTHLFRCES